MESEIKKIRKDCKCVFVCVCVIFNSTANGSFGIVLSKADF